MVNLTQIPMTLYPYLANTHGDANAVGAITKASEAAMHPKTIKDERLRNLMQWAEEEGLIMDV